MEERLTELYQGVAVHATADREHMAALELLALVMLADSHLGDDELGVLRELTEDWRGTAFSFEQYLGPAMAKARQAWADDTVDRAARRRSTPGSPAACCAWRCSRPPARSPASTTRSPPRRARLPRRHRRPLRLIVDPRGSSEGAADATATRSRPARSGRIVDVGEAGVAEQARRRPAPWSAPISSTSQPPGRTRPGAAATMRADGVEPVGAGEQRAVRLPVAHRRRRRRASRRRRTAGWRRRGRARRRPGSASNHDPAAMRTLAPARPMPARLARATSRASATTSVSHTVTPSTGSSAASDSPMAPEPVPRSATRDRAGGSARASSMATPATTSVSGRGISTRRSTAGRGGGSSSGRARRPAARRRGGGRPSRRGGRPSARVAGSSSTSSSAVGAAGHLAQPPRRRLARRRARSVSASSCAPRRPCRAGHAVSRRRRAGGPARRRRGRRRRRRGRRPGRRRAGRS